MEIISKGMVTLHIEKEKNKAKITKIQYGTLIYSKDAMEIFS